MFIKLLVLLHMKVAIPESRVEVPSSEIEAIWVPEGMVGPIVAIPTNENCFEVIP
jgi:hypothetical protein